MTREEKLEAIYKEIANDELTFGCKILIDREIATVIDWDRDWEWIAILREDWCVTRDDYENEFTIIGHPVMIGDVLDWVDEHNKSVRKWMLKYEKVIVYFWWNKKEPIDKQSDGCIDYVYSLIQKS